MAIHIAFSRSTCLESKNRTEQSAEANAKCEYGKLSDGYEAFETWQSRSPEVEDPDGAVCGDRGKDANAAPCNVVHLLVVRDELRVHDAPLHEQRERAASLHQAEEDLQQDRLLVCQA